MSTLYYIVRGQRGAQATSGGLQLDVSVGRLNLVMSVSAVAAAGEQMSNCLVLHCVASCPNMQTAVPNILQDTRI